MIVVMKRGATAEQIEHAIQRVEQLGLKAHPIYGTERTVIAAIGEKRDEFRQSLEGVPGVADLMPILAPYKVASREVKPEPTVVRAGSLTIGNGQVGIIAGPCSVESEEQTLKTARAVKAAGATALRGGAFKPRTSPYSFQGLKEDGLKILAAARDETGLAVVTEVIGTEDVALVARYADVLQIGARNMQNYRLLEAVGEPGKPVLLKARAQRHARRIAAGGRVHSQRRQPERDALRARHPHVRGPHPIYAAAGDGSLAARADASAGGGRSEPRHGPHEPRGADGRRRHRRRGRRADRRGPSRARSGAERRLSVARFRAIRAVDGGCRRVAEAVGKRM